MRKERYIYPFEIYILMHIISRKRILEFSENHPEAEQPLDRWYRIVKNTNFKSFSNLQSTFPSVEQVKSGTHNAF